MIRGNTGTIHDSIDDRRNRLLDAAIEQLKRAWAMRQNCQVVFNIGNNGSIKAKITLDVDLDIETKDG